MYGNAAGYCASHDHSSWALEKAMSALGKCFDASLKVQMKRLSETLKFDMVDGMPGTLAALPKEQLIEVIDSFCKNWHCAWRFTMD
jgi:hypothetical protein